MGYRLLKLVKMVGSALASGPSSAKNGIPTATQTLKLEIL